jgi:hypothetical protein
MRGSTGGSGRQRRLTVDEAEQFVFEITQRTSGQYYGPVDAALGLGLGVFYERVFVPVFEPVRRIFQTVETSVLVVTHECDIDQENQRLFNTDVLILPLIDFAELFSGLRAEKNDDDIRSYLSSLARDQISQLMYLPPLPPRFPRGIILYLNRITYTYVSEFATDKTPTLGALTAFGLERFRFKLENHFFREKFDRLPLSGPPRAH